MIGGGGYRTVASGECFEKLAKHCQKGTLRGRRIWGHYPAYSGPRCWAKGSHFTSLEFHIGPPGAIVKHNLNAAGSFGLLCWARGHLLGGCHERPVEPWSLCDDLLTLEKFRHLGIVLNFWYRLLFVENCFFQQCSLWSLNLNYFHTEQANRSWMLWLDSLSICSNISCLPFRKLIFEAERWMSTRSLQFSAMSKPWLNSTLIHGSIIHIETKTIYSRLSCPELIKHRCNSWARNWTHKQMLHSQLRLLLNSKISNDSI